MWYTGQEAIGPSEEEVFVEYAQIDPYIQKIFSNQAGIYQAIEKLEVVMAYGQSSYYFRYPSASMP